MFSSSEICNVIFCKYNNKMCHWQLYHSLVMFSAWPGSCFNITLTLSHDAVFCLGCLFAYFTRYLQFHICTKIYKCTVSVCIFDSRSWSKFRLASRCTWISDSRDVSLQYMRVLQSQEVHKKLRFLCFLGLSLHWMKVLQS